MEGVVGHAKAFGIYYKDMKSMEVSPGVGWSNNAVMVDITWKHWEEWVDGEGGERGYS